MLRTVSSPGYSFVAIDKDLVLNDVKFVFKIHAKSFTIASSGTHLKESFKQYMASIVSLSTARKMTSMNVCSKMRMTFSKFLMSNMQSSTLTLSYFAHFSWFFVLRAT